MIIKVLSVTSECVGVLWEGGRSEMVNTAEFMNDSINEPEKVISLSVSDKQSDLRINEQPDCCFVWNLKEQPKDS